MKLSEIEHRISALEHALSNLQRCPADPCHVHYAAEAAVAEPKYDVTQETWQVAYVNKDGILVKGTPASTECVCREPGSWMRGRVRWPQRRVLIAHAPEMYRLLSRLDVRIRHDLAKSHALRYDLEPVITDLLDTIQKELQENE